MAEWFILFSLFLFGSIIGSFLNVCILRIPGNMSVTYPASHCPACKKPIPFYFNIPLISYIILGAKCRYCKSPISFQYFFVELITPLTFVLLYFFFSLSFPLLLTFIFSAALIVITFIDLEHQIIPDRISLPGIIICFIFSFFVPWVTPLESAIGILAGGGILYIFAEGYHFLTKKEGMGGGDIKLLAMIGAFLGWKGALTTLMLGAFIGSFIGIILIIFKGKNTKYAIPFGPFLSAGAFLSLLWGEQIVYYYLNLGR